MSGPERLTTIFTNLRGIAMPSLLKSYLNLIRMSFQISTIVF